MRTRTLALALLLPIGLGLDLVGMYLTRAQGGHPFFEWLLILGGFASLVAASRLLRARRRWAASAFLIGVLICTGVLVQASLRPAQAAVIDCTPPTAQAWAGILHDNGWTGPLLLTGLQVMFGESSGDPCARNPSGARGPWQFMPNTLADENCALDPICSTREAKATYDRRGWEPWEAYTSGAYVTRRTRAEAAIHAAGLDTELTAAQPSPSSAAPGPGITIPIPGLGINPAELIWGTIAAGAYGMAEYLRSAFEVHWHATLAGEDDLLGKDVIAGVLVVDNNPLQKIWAVSLALALGGLLVLLLTIRTVVGMFRGTTQHDGPRSLLHLAVLVILMASSLFLITQVIAIDNALITDVDSSAALELRSLPAYQGIATQDPSALHGIQTIMGSLAISILAVVVYIETAVLTVIYFVRLLVLWGLVVVAPYALAVGLLPGGIAVTMYWLRLLLATVFFKFLNALYFATLVLMSAHAVGAIFNGFLVMGILLIMIAVPSVLWGALGRMGVMDEAHGKIQRGPVKVIQFGIGRVASTLRTARA